MGEETRPPVATSTIGALVAIGAIASALGIAFGLAIDWFPDQASTQAEDIDNLWDLLVICSVPFFVMVVVVVLYSVRAFKMKRGEEHLDGPSIHGSTKLEVIWTALPALLLVGLCFYAALILADIEDAPADAKAERQVIVVGEQFTWTFEYPGLGQDGKSLKTNRLYLPEGESVKFTVKSKDVIHDFWVPEFRMKIDAVPGVDTSYRVTPNRLGTYPVVCAELCGLGHAYMRQSVTVMPRGEWDAWVKKAANPPAPAGEESGGNSTASADGKAIFTDGNASGATACGACHTLADAGTNSGTGPALDDVIPGLGEEGTKKAIVDPEADIADGFSGGVMPNNYGEVLSEGELDALTDYLIKATE